MNRGGWVTSIAVAIALLLAVLPVELTSGATPVALVVIAATCVAGGIGWRYPRIGGSLIVALGLVLLFTHAGGFGLAAMAGVAPILSATLSRDLLALIFNMVGQFAVQLLIFLPSVRHTSHLMQGVISILILVIPPFLVGRLVLQLADRAEAARAEQEARMMQERRQLARDLHDTIVYATTTMVMRTEELRRRADLPEGLREELATIADTGRNATRGLRDLLSLLRQSGDMGAAVETLRPGVLDAVLRTQMDKLRHAGFDANAHVSGDLSTLEPVTADVLGALLVESSSNVVKHGNRHVPCSVFLDVEADEVNLAVLNGALQVSTPPDHEPMGITGMTERVEQVGGSFSAERSGDSFLVEAKLTR